MKENFDYIKEREKKQYFIDSINSLIHKSFGKSFFGHLHFWTDWKETGFSPTLRLEEICKVSILGNGRYSIGNFTKKDGSAMDVEEGYKYAARKYAELYKEKFGKEVTITYH